ncbi:type VI secretion system tube protein TssD [uncultured Aquimarina sp.]|uniref:type VI secretion system tube protein TssD n=1 Tax=uncultured Aquimarina sp. TaxID=575652 RepID=UPI0026160CD1|nr:type VI secretion system tube protein TssD [uncultured Aquimarina sp.]
MAFQAKLFINDEERNVIDSTFLYQQLMDSNGRPKTTIQDGKINVLIESTKNDELFYDWMFSTHTTYNGYVRFFKRDGFSKLFDFEFANCHCVHLEEKFNAEGNSPLKMELVLSPGIQRVRGQIFEKNWNPSNPFTNATPITEREENVEPEIEDMYYTDMNGEMIPDDELQSGTAVYLVLKTKNGVGKDVDIDLDDNENDFKYNGEVLVNDVIEDLVIKSDTQKIKLEIISQKK